MRKPFVVAAAVNDLEANNEIILHCMGVNTTITYLILILKVYLFLHQCTFKHHY
jgi:hypothetical protein